MPSERNRDKSTSKSDKKYKSDFKLTDEIDSSNKSKTNKSEKLSKYSSEINDYDKKASSVSSSSSKQKKSESNYDQDDYRKESSKKDSKSKSTSKYDEKYEKDRDHDKRREDKDSSTKTHSKSSKDDKERDRDRHKEKDRESNRDREKEEKHHRSSKHKEDDYENSKKNSTSKSKSKKYDSSDEDVKYKLKDDHKSKSSSNYNKNEKDEPNYDDAYEDDFENDFESDSSEKENVKKNRESSANKSTFSSSPRKDNNSYTRDSGTDDLYSKPSKSTSESKYYDYDDEDKNYTKRKPDTSNRIVKANALVKIPTDSVEVFSSRIYFNHDSIDRQKRRAKDLMKTIELDKKNINLLDLNPIEMRTVYSSHLKHQKVQTNDDIFDIEVQTDEIEQSNKWTQYPPDDSKGCGTDDKYNKTVDSELDILKKFQFELNLIDLHVFLQRSSKVVESLLNEKKILEMNNELNINKTDIEFSKGFLKFTLPKGSGLTKSASITDCCFSKDNPNYFVTSFIYSKPESNLYNSSILCVWNINESESPYRILVCETSSTALCYFSFIVVSGNIDGSVSIWDLRESSHLHYSNSKNKLSSETNAIRSPTYTTAGVLQNENHLSEIKSIITLQNTEKDNKKDVFMQIATLEIDCRIIIWTVVELKNLDLAIFETDLGLLPGGKLKLVKNSQIILDNFIRTPSGKIPFQTLCMNASTSNVNDFYVATNVGRILHINRKGSTFSSSLLKSDIQDGLAYVNCVSFHHDLHEIFLAGYGNGELRLYHINYLTPIKTWIMGCNNNKIKQIEWLQGRSSAFMVIDESDTLYMWDLLQDDTQNIFSKEIVNLGKLSFCEYKQKELENSRPPFALFTNGSKEVEIHFFTPDWANKNGDKEKKKFNKLIKNYLLTF